MEGRSVGPGPHVREIELRMGGKLVLQKATKDRPITIRRKGHWVF